MQMVLKEIGYRKYIPKSYYNHSIQVIDYCNDLSILLKQCLDIIFNRNSHPENASIYVYIHASEMLVANIHPMITYMSNYLRIFIYPQYLIIDENYPLSSNVMNCYLCLRFAKPP